MRNTYKRYKEYYVYIYERYKEYYVCIKTKNLMQSEIASNLTRPNLMNVPETYALMLIDYRYYKKFENFINEFFRDTTASEMLVKLIKSVLMKQDNISILIIARFVNEIKANLKCYYLIADYVIKNDNVYLLDSLLKMPSYYTAITNVAFFVMRYDLVTLVAKTRVKIDYTNTTMILSSEVINNYITNSIKNESYESIAYGLQLPGMSQKLFNENAMNWIQYSNKENKGSIIKELILNSNWDTKAIIATNLTNFVSDEIVSDFKASL